MLVSIVIPCYNSEHTIGKVVELAIEEFSKMKDYECELVHFKKMKLPKDIRDE